MLEPDNREWQRVPVDLPAKCRIVDGPARYDMIQVVDMNHQGCCMQGASQFQKGDVVRIIIELPFEGQISMTGEVIWSGAVENDSEDFRTGVRFVLDGAAAEETSLKLYHYCLLRQPKS